MSWDEEKRNIKISIYTVPIPCHSLISRERILGWLSQLPDLWQSEETEVRSSLSSLEEGEERREGVIRGQENKVRTVEDKRRRNWGTEAWKEDFWKFHCVWWDEIPSWLPPEENVSKDLHYFQGFFELNWCISWLCRPGFTRLSSAFHHLSGLLEWYLISPPAPFPIGDQSDNNYQLSSGRLACWPWGQRMLKYMIVMISQSFLALSTHVKEAWQIIS